MDREGAALAVRPATPARWGDVEAVFAGRGCSVARGCFCMYYRRSGAWTPARGQTRSQGNRAALKSLVDAGDPPPGLIAYRGKVPVGWVSLGPREDFAKLVKSPVMKAVDAERVWSIICFVVPSEHRQQGVARALLQGAIAFARRKGVRLLEAYPMDRPGRSGDETMWFGAKSMYDKAGFVEVARRKPARPIVRLRLR